MAQKEMILCDTDVLIHSLKGDAKTKQRLAAISSERIAISIITYAEILKGAQNKVDFEVIKTIISKFKIYPLSEEISQIFNGHVINYTLSHRIGIPDALIAATAISNNVKLFTYNTRDFNFIPEVKLYQSRI